MQAEETSPPNFLKDYAHARSLLKTTSRGKNPDWYRDAFLLSHQLHLFETDANYLAYFLDEESGTWSQVNTIPLRADIAQLEEYISYLRNEIFPGSCRSLGVVLHLNHETSVFEFPAQDWEELYPEQTLDELIRTDPALVLQDRTLSEELSFRIYPTPASPYVATTGCAVATSRRGEELLYAFREIGDSLNFPIRTIGLNAPLLLLSRLTRTLGPQEKPICMMLRFEDFSFLGFYTASGELILLRSIKHTSKQLPHSLESTLSSTAASVELAELEMKIFDCRRSNQLSLDDELKNLLIQTSYQLFVPPRSEELPLPIELTTFQIADDNPELAFAETETFGSAIADGSHLQDFLPATLSELEMVPTAGDMKLMRIGRTVKRIGLAACVLFGAFVAFNHFQKTSSSDWKDGESSKVETLALNSELARIKKTESFLADRSKGWVNMELLSRLFPLDGSVKLENAGHTSNAETTGKGAGKSAALVKKWVLKGFAREGATPVLSKLNTQEGMGEVFELVKETTGNSSVDLSKSTRSLLTNLDLSENPSFLADAPEVAKQSYPYKFTLTITQRIEAADKLAIPLSQL